MNHKLRIIIIIFSSLPGYLLAYNFTQLPFPISDLKVNSQSLDSLSRNSRPSTHHDFTFQDSCPIEYFEAQMIFNGRKQNLKFGFPFLFMDMARNHADLHLKDLPKYSKQLLPEINTWDVYLLLLPRPIDHIDLILYNKRLLASDLLLKPDLSSYKFFGPIGFNPPPRKTPTPTLSDVYNSGKAYPQFKLQDIELYSDYEIYLARLVFCPFEYLPKERKLFVYDLRIVVTYKDEIYPVRDQQWRNLAISQTRVYIDTHLLDYTYDSFLKTAKVGRDIRDILVYEYRIPEEVVERKFPQDE